MLLGLASGCFFLSSTGFGALFARAPLGRFGRAFSVNRLLRAGARTYARGVDFFSYFSHALFGSHLKARFLFGLMIATCGNRRQLGRFRRRFFFGGAFLGFALGFFRALYGEDFRRFRRGEYARFVKYGQRIAGKRASRRFNGGYFRAVRFLRFAARNLRGVERLALIRIVVSNRVFGCLGRLERAFERLLLYAAQLHCAHGLHFREKPGVAHGIVERCS